MTQIYLYKLSNRHDDIDLSKNNVMNYVYKKHIYIQLKYDFEIHQVKYLVKVSNANILLIYCYFIKLEIYLIDFH